MIRTLILASMLTFFVTHALAQNEGDNPNLMPEAPLNEQVVNLPGDPSRPVLLETTIFMPPGSGPFPLAILNHGATGASATNRGDRYRDTYSAYYFLSRGYAVAMPMARGFAGSGGTITRVGCDLERAGLDNAEDVRAVIAELDRLPQIDRDRVVVAGQSFGGWTTLALGTLSVPGVRGIIGFSPAFRASSCSSQDEAMATGARAFGAAAKLPSLWFYGDNDTVMPTDTWHAVYAAYTAAGGQASLVDVGTFLSDSHQMLTFPESLGIWTPRVDRFLASIGLPSLEIHPEYLPTVTPHATNFAPIDDVTALPGANDKMRSSYRDFLTRSFPRAFVIAPGSGAVATNGGFDPIARGLADCRKAGITCRPYAIDNDVVWTNVMATPRSFTKAVTNGKLTILDFAVALNRDCSSRGFPQFRLTVQPLHGVSTVVKGTGSPGFPPNNPYSICNSMKVPGVAVTYKSNIGYIGPDTIAFEETDVDGGHHLFQGNLTVH